MFGPLLSWQTLACAVPVHQRLLAALSDALLRWILPPVDHFIGIAPQVEKSQLFNGGSTSLFCRATRPIHSSCDVERTTQ